MFAVIRTGGKQYKVAKDDVIAVEKLVGEPGGTIALGEVLMVGEGAAVAAGTPLVADASVTATIIDQRRGDKIIVFKKKRRKNYRRKKGHRQYETVLRITEINTAATAAPEESAVTAMPAEIATPAASEELPAATPEQTAQETERDGA